MVGLSESDLERIKKFNDRPWYAKDPDILLPDDEEEDSAERDASE